MKMEPVTMPDYTPRALPPKDWAATGWGKDAKRPRAVINSLYIEPDRCEGHNLMLQARYNQMAQNETMVAREYMDDAEIALVAYGTTARIALTAVRRARERGIKAGLIRPVTVWPFPSAAISAAAVRVKAFLAVEMSLGQMVDDVRLAVDGARPVHFYGRTGGIVPGVNEIFERILSIKEGL
jgi:2-oxoglutarate ferredoxin oxidoreductase subunit alpha